MERISAVYIPVEVVILAKAIGFGVNTTANTIIRMEKKTNEPIDKTTIVHLFLLNQEEPVLFSLLFECKRIDKWVCGECRHKEIFDLFSTCLYCTFLPGHHH